MVTCKSVDGRQIEWLEYYQIWVYSDTKVKYESKEFKSSEQ